MFFMNKEKRDLEKLMRTPNGVISAEKKKKLGFQVLSGVLSSAILIGGYLQHSRLNNQISDLVRVNNNLTEALYDNHVTNESLKSDIVYLNELVELKDTAYSTLEDQITQLEHSTMAIGGSARSFLNDIKDGNIDDTLLSDLSVFYNYGVDLELLHRLERHNLTKYDLVFDWMRYPVMVPSDSFVSSPFGYGPFGDGFRFHRGADIVSPYNKNILSMGDGRVVVSNYESQYPFRIFGKTLIIEHYDNIDNPTEIARVLYAHMDKVNVSPGDIVEKGEIIGIIGSTGFSTGPHIHLELYIPNDEFGWRLTNPFATSTYGRAF